MTVLLEYTVYFRMIMKDCIHLLAFTPPKFTEFWVTGTDPKVYIGFQIGTELKISEMILLSSLYHSNVVRAFKAVKYSHYICL